MKLHLAPDLQLPLEAVTESLAFLGRKGSGKSYTAHKLAEEMHRCKVQFVGLDPVGIWYGLRLAADGKSPGLPIPVLGGLHGDIPLEATGGALIADLVVDRGVSVVLDVSQFESDADKARFARAFADRFYFRKKASPSPVHIFIEECQEFVPQNPQREEAHMLHAFTRMAKIGRNFGIGLSLISQRPQEVNKKVLNLTELLFAFQLTGPHERKTIEGWIAEKGIDEDIAGELPKLEQGEPHVWSPAWLKISKRVKIDQKWTFDASSTPKVGKEAAAHELSPIDLEQLRTAMAATIERAKAEDPRLLRQKISELTRQLASRAPVEKTVEKTIEVKVPVLKDGQLARIEKLSERFAIQARDYIKAIEELKTVLALAATPPRMTTTTLPPGLPKPGRIIHEKMPVVRQIQRPFIQRDGGLQSAERKFLVALAQQARPLTRNQVAIFAGYSASSRHVDNTLAALRAGGYVTGGREGITITTEGLTVLGPFDPLPTGPHLQTYWIHELDKAAGAFLSVICEAYPATVSRDQVAEKAGYSPSSRHVDNTLAQLRSRDLVTGGRNAIRASENLF